MGASQCGHAAERRDKWIENYQRMELAKSGQVAEHTAYIRELLSRVRAPLTGYVMQEGFSEGLYADGWARPKIALRIRPLEKITALRVRIWRPDYAPAPATLTVRLEGDLVADTTVGHGVFEVAIGGAEFLTTRAARLEIECEPAFRPEGDNRELAFVLMEIRAEHG